MTTGRIRPDAITAEKMDAGRIRTAVLPGYQAAMERIRVVGVPPPALLMYSYWHPPPQYIRWSLWDWLSWRLPRLRG